MAIYYKYVNHNFQNSGRIFAAFGTTTWGTCGSMHEFPLFSAALSHNWQPGPVVNIDKWPGPAFTIADPNSSFIVGASPVSSVTEVLVSFRHKSPSKLRDFLKARAEGRIVLNPLEQGEIKATLYPGPTSYTKLSNYVDLVVNGWKSLTDVGRWCGNQNMYIAVPLVGNITADHDPFYYGSLPARYPTLWKHYERYSFTGSLSLPPRYVVNHYQQLLLDSWRSAVIDTGLVTRARAAANAGAMDLLTELAELKETASFIMGSIKELLRLYIETKRNVARLRKQPGKAIKAIADDIASTWMAYRYAISPIVYTINDSLNYFESSYKSYQTFRQGLEISVELEPFDGWSASSDLKIINRVFLKHRYAFDDKLHNLGFNFAATAWELVPLSFVVDWALNVGDLLVSLQVPSNVEQESAQYSWQVKPQVITFSKGPQRFDFHVKYYRSLPINISAHVGLAAELDMSWKRWADAASLSWFKSRSTFLKG